MDLILLIYLSCLLISAETYDEVINITNFGQNENITLNEGAKTLVLNFLVKTRYKGKCTAKCDGISISSANPSCNLPSNEKAIRVEFDKLVISQAFASSWMCTIDIFNGTNANYKSFYPKFNVMVKQASNRHYIWWYVGGAVGFIVLLVIIIQTGCILYFKSKARQAEINQNLTPRNNSAQYTARYEVRPKKKNSTDEVRETIYEALDTVTDKAPPPPPVETIPGTPKLGNNSRSISQSDLAMRDLHSHTASRPRPKNPSSKFNTVDGSSSLRRIKNRPFLPLPIPEETYEIMKPDNDELPRLPKHITEMNSIFETSRPMGNKPRRFFGQTPPVERKPTHMRPGPHHTTDINNSPITKRKQPLNDPYAGRVTPSGRSVPFPGPNIPAPGRQNTRPKVNYPDQNMTFTGQNTAEPRIPSTVLNRAHGGPNRPYPGQNWRSPGPGSQRSNLDAIPDLPSMISPANLRPVRHFKSPADDNSRMSPAQSFTNLASRRPPPPPAKPMPRMLLPIPVQPAIETSDDEDIDDPRATWGEEWTYEKLPEYKIYGNVPLSR